MMPVSRYPEHPDGTKYAFDCCAVPDVWWSGDEAECRTCEHDWTEALEDQGDPMIVGVGECPGHGLMTEDEAYCSWRCAVAAREDYHA